MKLLPDKHLVRISFTFSVCLALMANRAQAADGAWSSGVTGNWSAAANWAGNVVADGSGSTAFFTNDITSDIIVHLDSARTNGNLLFSDGDINTAATWTVDNNGTAANVLRLEGPSPGITVGALGADKFVNITGVIAGTNLTETGPGLLVLSGANTFSNMVINGGRVVWNNGGNGGSPGAFGAGTTNNMITLTNGATIIRSNTANNLLWCLNVKGTNTLDGTGVVGGNLNGLFLGDGTLNMILPPSASSLTTGGNNPWNSNVWAAFQGTVILSGGGNLRFDINNGNTRTFGSKLATFDLGTTNTMNERGANGIATHTTFLGALKGGPGTAVSVNSVAGATNTLQVGDANLDTTFNGVINNPNVSAFTAFTKSGSGSLVLTGTNGYSGVTVVQNGKLVLGATGFISNTPSISVLAPGVLDGSASVIWTNNLNQSLLGNGTITGSVYVASGFISPGAGTNIGRLTFANDLTVSGTMTNTFKTGFSVTNDSILVQGNLVLEGVTTIQVAPPIGGSLIPNGTYSLIKWSGLLTGDLSNLSLAYPAQVSGASLVLQTNLVTKEILLVVSGNAAGNLTWRGDGSGNTWDHSTPNWRTTGGGSTIFSELDSVLFDDTGSNNVPVNLTETVTPSSTAVNNTNKDYVINGSGKITGVTGLAKNGSGKLTVLTDNDFSGAVAINGGTIQIGNGPGAGSLGTGSLINNGTVIYNRDASITLGAPLAGSGTLIQDGTNGTLVLTGNSTHNGGILVKAGTLQLGDGNSVNGSVTTTITNNATLKYLYNASATILNGISGNGVVNFDKNPAGNNAYVFPLTATNSNFTGTVNISPAVTLHANTGNGGFNLGNGNLVNVPVLGQAWLDSSATNYNQSFNIAGNGWSGDTAPAGSPGLGALRIFNCTLTGPIVLTGDARIGGSSSGATFRGPISGDFQLELLGTTANPDNFILTFAPTNGFNSWRTTLVTRGVLQAGNANAVSNAVTLTGESRMWLNGNNISIASLAGGVSINGTNCFILNNNTTNPAVLIVGSDGNSTSFDGIFANGNTQPLGLTKVGAGTLILSAINSNSGPVSVNGGTLQLIGEGSFSNSTQIAIASGAVLDVVSRNDGSLNLQNGQTLKGAGTLNGSLVTLPGSIVNPGSSIGTLTVANNATLNGTLLMEINRSSSPNSDHLNVTGTLTAGGTLQVTNIGPALQANDVFPLFAGGVSGFTVNLPATDPLNGVSYTWQNDVAANGSVKVLSVTALTPPVLNYTQAGNTLTFTWSGPFRLQTNSINVTGSNWNNYPGGTTNPINIVINPAASAVFFRLSSQ